MRKVFFLVAVLLVSLSFLSISEEIGMDLPSASDSGSVASEASAPVEVSNNVNVVPTTDVTGSANEVAIDNNAEVVNGAESVVDNGDVAVADNLVGDIDEGSEIVEKKVEKIVVNESSDLETLEGNDSYYFYVDIDLLNESDKDSSLGGADLGENIGLESVQMMEGEGNESSNQSNDEGNQSIEILSLSDYCELRISGLEEIWINLTKTHSYEINLNNGNYFWNMSCGEVFSMGNFSVNFSSRINASEWYLAGKDTVIPVYAEQGSSVEINSPSGNFQVSVDENKISLSGSQIGNVGNYNMKLLDSNSLSVNVDSNSSLPDPNLSLSIVPVEVVRNFSTFNVTIQAPTSGKVGENISMNFSISSAFSSCIILVDGLSPVPCSGKSINLSKSYNSLGNYNLAFFGFVGSTPFNISQTISITSNNSNNTNLTGVGPTIMLLSPAENLILDASYAIFNYSVKNATQCILDIYNMSSGSTGPRIFTENKSISNFEENFSVRYDGLGNGKYQWWVNCRNNQSTNYAYRNFNVSIATAIMTNAANLSVEQETVRKVLAEVNNFLSAIDGYGLDERETLDMLKISLSVDASKKRLLQIDTDISNGLRFMEITERTKKLNDYLGEVSKIRNETPTSFSIIAKDEYTKYSPTQNFEDIFKLYIGAEKISAKNTAQYINYQKKMQANTTVVAKIRQVEVGYLSGIKQMTVVIKDVKSNAGRILEVLPKDVADSAAQDLSFITNNKIVVDDPIVSIETADLGENKLVYYVSGHIELAKMRNIDTISVFEGGTDGEKITGFSVAIGDIGSKFFVLFFISVVIVVFLSRAIYSRVLMKDESYGKAVSLIKNIKRSLRERDFEGAEGFYRELHAVSLKMTGQGRKKIFNEAKYLFNEILLLKARLLTRDCIALAKENNKREATYSYSLLQQVYKKLPKRYKSAVYEKLQVVYRVLHKV